MNVLARGIRLHQFRQTKFDLIISNPPYYENSLLSENDRTSRAKHAEFLPVDLLVTKATDLLADDGVFWVIIPSENSENWINQAQKNDLHVQQSISIIGKEGQGEKRRVLAFGRIKTKTESSSLTVRDGNGNYSKEYIQLTKEFDEFDTNDIKIKIQNAPEGLSGLPALRAQRFVGSISHII